MFRKTRYGNDIASLVRLQTAFSAGSLKAVKIYDAACAAGIRCDDAELLSRNGIITERDKAKLLAVDSGAVSKIFKDCDKNGIDIVGINDARFPTALKNIPTPPLILYVKGELPDTEHEPIICIVGPREISQFGAKAAYSLARRLSRAGFTVVSGGARGGDTYAHRGALEVGGKSVCVLGCGIACDYLPENRRLRNKIAESGCLISEYPPYKKASEYTFPVRNRLLSGISLGVAVIEADEHSGTLITARHACEQGKDVFAIPGNPTLNHYKGSNALLRDGAFPLTSAKDITNEYIGRFPDKIDIERAFAPIQKKEEKNQKKLKLGLSKQAEIVYNNLDRQKFTVDDLLKTGIEVDELLSALTELEMEALIEALPGGMYRKN